jgi:D-3-phosphoglycerate dehydrogenase / 2-oxoglutarate reductase
MRVTILDDYFDTVRTLECFNRLRHHEVTVITEHVDDAGDLATRLADTEALVLIRERTRITADLLDRLPALRLISQRSVFPHIDVEACTRLGIVVSSDLHPGTPSYATAELAWGLILASQRDLPRQLESLRQGRWQAGVGRTLRGKVLGIYGYGRIGRVMARYGRAFDMEVQFWASEASRDQARAEGETVAADRESFFSGSDVISLHLRLVPATRGLVGPADLARMRPDALLVNTSRAGLIPPGVLESALREGRPGRAAVDVYEQEPVTDPDQPLLALDNVLGTPHIGYVTREEWELQFADVFDQINNYASGRPTNVVNPEVLSGARFLTTPSS